MRGRRGRESQTGRGDGVASKHLTFDCDATVGDDSLLLNQAGVVVRSESDGSRSRRHPREDGAIVKASAAVLEASVAAPRTSSLGKPNPRRVAPADEARRKLTVDCADRFAAEDSRRYTLTHANVHCRRRARSPDEIIRRLRSWIFGSSFSRRDS